MMIRACISLALCIATAATSGLALEGNLPKEKKEALEGGSYSFGGGGQWTIKNVVGNYNNYDAIKGRVKIGVDQKLSLKTVTDFKVTNSTILAALEKLASTCGAKLYAINNSFLYITDQLPAGFSNPSGGAITPPPPPSKPEPKTGTRPPPPNNVPPPQPNQPQNDHVGMTALQATFPNCTPGTSTIISWSHVAYEDCKKDPRPKVLLVYDDDPHIETNNTGIFFETLLLEDPECVAALKNFYFVKLGASERTTMWPDNLLEAAKMPESAKSVSKSAKVQTNPISATCTKGAALYLLKPDCTPTQICWTERNPQVSVKALLDAAKVLSDAPKPPPPPVAVAEKVNGNGNNGNNNNNNVDAKEQLKEKLFGDKKDKPEKTDTPEKPKKKVGTDDEKE